MRWDLTPNPLSIPMERGLNERMDWADAKVTSGGGEKIDHLKLPEVVSADSGGEVTCVTCWVAEVVPEVSCRRLVARVADNRRMAVMSTAARRVWPGMLGRGWHRGGRAGRGGWRPHPDPLPSLGEGER
jgi:hypothetical protein